MLSSMERLAKKVLCGPYVEALLGSTVLLLIWLVFGNLYLGLGGSTIMEVFKGEGFLYMPSR